MPVDPTISLGVTGGSNGMASPGYTAGTAVNPLTMAGSYAETQKRLNDVKLFNQEFAAKQRLGQIMAQSPDIPTAIEKAQADPSVAAFVPDLLNTIVTTQNTMQSYRGQKQSQTADAFTHALSLLPGEFVSPGSMKKNLPGILSQIPDPSIRDTVSKSMSNIMEGLTTDLPGDPTARKQEIAKRITAAGLQNPGMLEAMKGLWGTPDQIDTGPKIQPGNRSSSIPSIINEKPSSFTPSGNALNKGLPPQVVPGTGVVVGGSGATASGGGQAGAKSAPPTEAPASGLGTPLFDKDTEMKPPPVQTRDVSGNPAGLEGGRAADLRDAHNKEDLNRYKAAQDTEAQLADVSHDIESLGAKGGFLSPGAGGEVRTQIAKFGKLFQDVTGTKLDIDVDGIANAEDLMKATNRMTLDFLNSKLGNQREAAETIRNMTDKGMPGINNTLLGSRLMLGMIGALNQRTKDSYRWDDEWAGRNNGDLRGSAAAFDTKYNSQKYINKALADLGMNEHGFTPNASGKAALQKALDSGLLTFEQAEEIRKNKGRIPNDLPKAEGQ